MTRQRTSRRLLGTGAPSPPTGALVLTGCGSDSATATPAAAPKAGDLTSSDDALTILIGSTGDAETDAVNDGRRRLVGGVRHRRDGVRRQRPAAAALAGLRRRQPRRPVLPRDRCARRLRRRTARSSPTATMLENKDDFYPSLVKNFTYDDQFYCAPKDFSTLALVINTDMWDAAGPHRRRHPDRRGTSSRPWPQTLTDRRTHVGLAFGAEYQRVGAFMAQAGGGLVSDDGTEADRRTAPRTSRRSTYVQDAPRTTATSPSRPTSGAGWGGEAFGKGLAAMTIEGNWITGAMSNDYPDVDYTVAELPAGPARPGHAAVHQLLGHGRRQPQPAGRARPRAST